MDRFEPLRLFVAGADHGGLSTAARPEGVAPSTTSLALGFREGARTFSVRVSGDRMANDGGTLRGWATAGAGPVLTSSCDIEDDLATGRLGTALEPHPDPGAGRGPRGAVFRRRAGLTGARVTNRG
ncbi:hypothetical protein [Chenggangzhangella methanolivorans]|uniref:Uncharacterized protein n=1 Tax=Chenggangzhangella methanolivorans TaxID=1437009 RepID=A0A9E6R7V1_9HYPH|nr:hypothetical protein [Chenggangzhangella methanolivorans]QZN98257.1 hypothetical protein K6K41_13955 [Chenggangzhangella methanolivorans]